MLCFFLCGPRIIPELLAQVGREVDWVARLLVLPGSGEQVQQAARRSIVSYALVPYYARSLARQDLGAEVAAIGAAWRSGDREAAAGQVSDAMVDELLLTGTEEQIAERLAGYRRAGLRTPVIAIGGVEPHGAGDAVLRRLLEAFAPARAVG